MADGPPRYFENFAAYFAFTDQEVGRLLDAVKELPDAENTMVIYIVGDNGASAEGGPDGTLNEIKGLNGINTSIEEILPHLDKLGGPESEPHYPVGWAWAGNAPFQWVKQVASHLGGTRNPMVVTWPAKIKHDSKPRNIKENFSEVVRRMDELGGPTTFNHYPMGWAHAMDSPFQWTKQVASHFGGTRNGVVISWPKRIKKGNGLRTQFHHAIDILPTILDVVGIPQPKSIDGVTQIPIEGVRMAYTWDKADAPSTRKTQYFEMFGNRAIYHDGWVAATTPPTPPWVSVVDGIDGIDDFKWELYHIADDFSESIDLAASEPKRLQDMQRLFYIEAVKYQVLPIDNSKVKRLDVSNRPSLTEGRNTFTYYNGMIRIPEGSSSANVAARLCGTIQTEHTIGSFQNGWYYDTEGR